MGFTLEIVLGKPAKQTRAKPPAKYRHPTDPSKSWSGRGKKPTWLVELLEAGKKLEELTV